MRDLYLRFPDEDAWTALALEPEPAVFEIDVLGVICTRRLNEEDVEEPLPGWRVNIRCRDDRDLGELESFAITPATPRRVWG